MMVMMMVAIAAPAYDISVFPMQDQFVVNDVIVCSAKGFPDPNVQWMDVENPENTVRGSNLTVTEDMIGKTNSWTCTAGNLLNDEPLSTSFDFTVVGMRLPYISV